jgi:hypothetical protein
MISQKSSWWFKINSLAISVTDTLGVDVISWSSYRLWQARSLVQWLGPWLRVSLGLPLRVRRTWSSPAVISGTLPPSISESNPDFNIIMIEVFDIDLDVFLSRFGLRSYIHGQSQSGLLGYHDRSRSTKTVSISKFLRYPSFKLQVQLIYRGSILKRSGFYIEVCVLRYHLDSCHLRCFTPELPISVFYLEAPDIGKTPIS